MPRLRPHLTFQNLLLTTAIALLYFFSGKLGLTLAFLNPSATAVWAPTGIALAALLFFGSRAIPGIFLGAFFVNNLTAGTPLTSLGIAIGNTLEGVIGAYLVKKFANGIHAFENTLDLFKFTLLAAIFSTTISASIGVSTLILGGLAQLHDFWPVWTTWWLGDMSGNLIVAPLLIIWGSQPISRFSLKSLIHAVIAFTLLLAVTSLVFSGTFPYSYLCIPLTIWIGFWFGQRGVTLATILVSIIALSRTLRGDGPFVMDKESLNVSVQLVQFFLDILSLTALTFSAAILAIKKGEKNLASHQERFKALIENSFDAIVLIEASSRIVYASASVKRLLGYEPEELIGTTGFDLIAPEDKSRTMNILASLVLKPSGVTTTQYRTIRKDGQIIWVEATGTNLLFEPNVNAVVINFRDITEKRFAEEKIKREKMFDEAMLTSIGEGIIATDSQGKITMVNQATCEILGWTEAELIGEFLTEKVGMQNNLGEKLKIADRPITKVLSLGKEIVTSPTNYYIKKDGSTVPVRFTITPIIMNDQVDGTIEVFYDITKEKEIDRAKSEFVSLASHQLRTPLATINWYLEELMKKGKVEAKKQLSYLEEVYHASNRMVALINALLNTSRLELGTFIVEPKKTDLIELSKQVLNELHPQIEKKQLTMVQRFQKELPTIFADPKFLIIIIQNLLANAIKYSPEKTQIIFELSHDTKGFVISVTDAGCGIPQKQQAKIFSKMFRADNARSIDPEGSGLGLYIIKSIVDATTGTVSFVSEENKGSTFTVTFPSSGMQKKPGEKQLR
jgi:PAS domain S-box-containing protein